MNSELNKTIMEVIKVEVMELVENYDWEWNEKDMCYYNIIIKIFFLHVRLYAYTHGKLIVVAKVESRLTES